MTNAIIDIASTSFVTIDSMLNWGLITLFGGLFVWYIRYLIQKNDKNADARMGKMESKIDNIKDSISNLKVEIGQNYLPIQRFERHELDNKKSLERIHDRIDELK